MSMLNVSYEQGNHHFREDNTEYSFSEDISGPSSDQTFSYRPRTTSLHRNFSIMDHRQSWIDSDSHGRPLEKQVDDIVNKIEQEPNLSADTQQAEQLRREALRDMPQSLTMKKHVKHKLTNKLNQRSKGHILSCHKRFMYKISMTWTKMKSELHNLMYTFQLWYSILKRIEGQFGSAVATFFRFFRWLFLLNVCSTIICFFFIVFPQILENYESSAQNSQTFEFVDIFTGEGYLANTILFYGFYTNTTISPASDIPYSMPHAYFFTMIFIYFLNLVILSFSMARSYRRNFIETKDGLKKVFSHKIFSGWDYSIATHKAANLKSSSIYNELKELLHEFNAPAKKTSCLVAFWTITIQIIINILTLLLLAGLGYVLWILLDQDVSNIKTNNINQLIEEDSDSYNETDIVREVKNLGDASYDGIITAVVINTMMFIVPYIFTHITKVEDYKNARVTFYVSLLRTFMLELLIIGILIVFWVLHAENGCWETSLGQEIYRLVIFDFIFSIIFLVLTDISRSLIYRTWKGIGSPEFDLARYTLQLTYNQTLFWVGLYFSPMLAVVVVLKMFITWYMISAFIIHFCEPSSKSWRAAQTQTWFLIMSFVCLLLVMAVLGYVIISKSTSECGPFRHLMHVYDIIKLGILSMENGSTVWVILIFITKPGAVAIILLSMCMAVYYLSAKAQAQERTVGEYEKMLNNQRKDKEYLLKQISEVTKGQWQYNLQENSMDPYRSPSSYTMNRRNRRDIGDTLDTMSSDLLLPSSSNSTFPLDDDNSNVSVPDRFKLN